MTYLTNFFYYLQQFAKGYPFQFILIIFIFVILLFLKIISTRKKVSRDYKIYNFLYNDIVLLCYISFFVSGILYLRFIRWGFNLELWPIYDKYVLFLKNTNALDSIVLLELLLLVFISLYKLKKHFQQEILKRHLYFYFSSQNKTYNKLLGEKKDPLLMVLKYEYSFYVQFINNIRAYWSQKSVIDRIAYNIFIRPYCYITKKDHYSKLWYNATVFMLKYCHNFFLMFFLIYDIYFNSFCLHKIFYYLPFYFIYNAWVRVSEFLRCMDNGLDFIIFERYYEEENVLYSNTTKDEDELILGYISRGFRSYLQDLSFMKDREKWDALVCFSIIFKQQRRFVKSSQDPTIFVNIHTGEEFNVNSTVINEVYT